MSIGAFLRSCRNRAGFNQIQMAAVLKVNQSDISKYENNSKEPPTSIFKDWTVKTQSMELGIAFLYGTELLTIVPDALNTVVNAVTGFINFLI